MLGDINGDTLEALCRLWPLRNSAQWTPEGCDSLATDPGCSRCKSSGSVSTAVPQHGSSDTATLESLLSIANGLQSFDSYDTLGSLRSKGPVEQWMHHLQSSLSGYNRSLEEQNFLTALGSKDSNPLLHLRSNTLPNLAAAVQETTEPFSFDGRVRFAPPAFPPPMQSPYVVARPVPPPPASPPPAPPLSWPLMNPSTEMDTLQMAWAALKIPPPPPSPGSFSAAVPPPPPPLGSFSAAVPPPPSPASTPAAMSGTPLSSTWLQAIPTPSFSARIRS